jgi:lipopolysaccharide transport system permease protein
MSKIPNISVIRPRSGWELINVRELWQYRELLYIFAWRDIKVRYKQTFIGVAWAVLQPFLLMVVFSFFFGRLAGLPSDGIPYPIFVFSGLIFWNYFAAALSASTNSLVDHESMLNKIYFPRLLLPFAAVVTPLVDLVISLGVLFLMMAYYGLSFDLHLLWVIPLAMIVTGLAAAGVGSGLTAINIRFRDVRYALPFFLQIGLFLTPVIYPVSIVEEKYQWLLHLNPISGVVQNARATLVEGGNLDLQAFGIAGIIAFCCFFLGIFYFRKVESIFADVA